MRRKLRGLAVLLCLGAGLLVCASSAASAQTYRTRTEHYSVETDISPRFAQVVADHMEAILHAYAEQFQGYAQVRDAFNVKVFRTKLDYMHVVPSGVQNSIGVFMPDKQLLAAHAEGRTAEEVLRTLYHEGFHQFMFCAISKSCPMWLNEGMAEYFSESTWNGSGFAAGEVPTARLAVLQGAVRAGSYIPLPQLLGLEPQQWNRLADSDSTRASLMYTEAWSVVHFLVHADGGRYAQGMNAFLKKLADGDDQERAFAESFGSDTVAFQAAWARYVMGLTPSPKFVCRDHMEALMVLAKMIYPDPRDFRSMDELRRAALSGAYRWTLTSPNGETTRSDDRQKATALFRCPMDTGTQDTSYVVVHDTAGMPYLICVRHPGIVIKAYYRQDPLKGFEPVVDEEVVDTLRDDLRAAIAAALK